MKTIAVIARKGGSGKTTVAVNLALAAHRAGKTTVLADTDPQGSAAEVMKVRTDPGPTLVTATGETLPGIQRDAVAAGTDLMIVDTPAALVEDIAHAIALSHLAVIVVRPTFLDLAAALQTAQILRSLRKPGLILLNQAQVGRGGFEPASVLRAQEALQLIRLPVVPTVLRSRVAYQQAMNTGRSVEEYDVLGPAAREVQAAWRYICRFSFGEERKAG